MKNLITYLILLYFKKLIITFKAANLTVFNFGTSLKNTGHNDII